MSVPMHPSTPDWPNLRHLRLLEIAARENSLTRAAQQVAISQPAASQAIAKLARIFGAPLLERVGNAAIATPEGRLVTERASRALLHLRDPALVPRARARQSRDDLLERYSSMTHLRVMALLALSGSTSATAQALGQTEASVRRAVKDVERIIGQPVMEGGQRNRSLSDAGARVATSASLALREIDLAHAELRERKGIFDSRLVIGALPLARTQIVPRAVVRLLKAYPAARLEILDGSYEFLLHRLRLGACDVIVGALRNDEAEQDLCERRLFSDCLRVVARAGHPLVGRANAARDLGAFPWIVPRRDAPARRVFDALACAHDLSARSHGQVETGSLVVLRGVLLASDALALMSMNQISYEIEQGLIVPLYIALDGAEREIGITELKGHRPGSLHTDFLRFLALEAGSL
ncbi:MAG: LysR family transcriptional regulator [Rhodobacteraceae bacterium]|nr:MAG: LysR family transcriptional regulator [Paracoccaceae bacterium]